MSRLSSAAPEDNPLLDVLLAELLDRDLPFAVRARALVELSDTIEHARSEGKTAFCIAGVATADPEILIFDLLGLSVTPAVRTAAQHQQRLDAAGN